MSRRIFEDNAGRVWKVTKLGSNLTVEGNRDGSEKLIDIARSCASRTGVRQTKAGVPLEYINEHRRIWNAIWDSGKPSI